jgi:uncharacterized protein with von Willebrand factor type A (vWA) domain
VLDKLLEFGSLCRKNGLRVSTSELLDMVTATRLTGVADPEILRDALEVTLVKRHADAALFDELFSLYFRRRGEWDRAQPGEVPPLVEALRKEGLSDDEIEHLIAMLADEAARMSPLARSSLGLRRTQLEALIRLSGIRVDFSRLQNPMQIGYFTQQLLDALNPQGARAELDALFARLDRRVGAERAELMARVAGNELGKMRTSLRRYVADEFERRNVDYVEQMRQQLLTHKPFGAMSEEELTRLRGEVTRLARKLKQLAALRPRLGRRGRLDARRTLRRAVATGGIPFRLVHKRRRIDKPRLVVLCDISDSVRHVSRFMLQFAYTLQELFSKVRSFVFVSDLGECTELFKENEIQRAVDLTYSGGIVNVYANSNFGRAFRLFEQRHLEAVTAKTTVLVIGDARNNYNPAEAWALGAIRERARRVLWLNPEPPASWSFGDSAMRDYEPYCDRVETVGNLAQLAKVVDTLIL